jgi:alkylation response protein AidB-like acyl-CoA dehydrogenase
MLIRRALMFEFTEQYEPLLRDVRKIAEKVVKPRAKEIEESDEFPVDMAKRFFQEGYLQILVPKELGGMGKDVTSLCIISEEIAKLRIGLQFLGLTEIFPMDRSPSAFPAKELRFSHQSLVFFFPVHSDLQ